MVAIKSLNKSAEENVQKGPPAIAFRYLGKEDDYIEIPW